MALHPYALLEADDSVLLVIDVQDDFLQKLPPDEPQRLLNSICWTVRLAHWSGVPLLVTAEEPATQPVSTQLLETLPSKTVIHDKAVFGLAGQPDLLAQLEQTGRRTVVLVGLETDVCVMHTALGLLARGFRVVVVADAVGTPPPGQELGLRRMERAGAIISDTKGLFYEWLRTIEAVNHFHRENPEMRALAGRML